MQDMDNTRSSDRVLSLAPMDGQNARNTAGKIDPRLFTGEQKLHLKMDPQTTLWYFQYESNGLLPEPLQGRFTGFKSGLKFAEEYYRKRNVQITQIKD